MRRSDSAAERRGKDSCGAGVVDCCCKMLLGPPVRMEPLGMPGVVCTVSQCTGWRKVVSKLRCLL